MPKLSGPNLICGALLVTTILGGAAVHAQSTSSFWDPSQLPETKGTVQQYTLTPRGQVDGLILVDGTEVKLPPHLTAEVVFAIKPGDAVTIHGLRARAVSLVDGFSVSNDTTGATVVDTGPPERGRPDTTLTGKVVTTLHGKRGEVNGALLDNRTVLRLPPPEAARWSNLLQGGQTVSVRGTALVTPLGTVMDVEAIGASPDQLTQLDVRPPRERRGPAGRDSGGADPFVPPPRG